MSRKRTKPARARPFSAQAHARGPKRVLCRAGFRTCTATMAALTAALVLATLCSTAIAHAQENISASVGVTLSPIESINQEKTDASKANADSGNATVSASEPEDAPKTAALPRTGDQTIVAFVALSLVILATGTALWLWRSRRLASKTTQRCQASRLLGIMLALCLAMGTAPATAAQATAANDELSRGNGQSRPFGEDSDQKEVTSERQHGLEETSEANIQAACDDGENISENSQAQETTSEQNALSESPASPPTNASPLTSLSPLAAQRSYDSWGSYSYRIVGEPVIGTRISILFTPGSELDSSVQPEYTWYYAPFEGTPFTEDIGNTSSIVVPKEALGMNLHVRIDDAAGKVNLTLVFVIGAAGYKLTGSAAIEGPPVSGLTLQARTSDLPDDCDPEIDWYSGPEPNAASEYLGQGTSLHLDGSLVGKYVTIRVKDSRRHYAGYHAATVGPVQRGQPAAPDILETQLFPNGTLSAICRANGTSEQPISAVALELKGADGQWRELDRKTPSDAQTASEVSFSADLSDEFQNSGSVRVRAVSYSQSGTSATSAECTVSAQIGVTVPLSLECRIAGDGSVSSEAQTVQNTGTLNAVIDRIETDLAPGMESGGDWTCSSGGTILFQGAFGSEAPVVERLVMAPGEGLPIAWSASRIDFETIEPSTTPMAYGTVTYVVSPALG